jgi:hypothetical protein
MASRCLVIPFPIHRIRRRAQRVTAAYAAVEALREIDALEYAQLKLCFWCFALSAVLMSALPLVL